MRIKPPVKLDKFMDLLLDAVCVVDREGYFLFVSAASERIFGYTPEEMIGMAVIDLVHPDDREKTTQTINEILDGELKPYFENRYVRKDGTIAHIMWSARWSESDQIRVAVARDVTEQKHAQSMQAALYAISEAAHGPEDLPALFKRIHQVINNLLPTDTLIVTLHDPEIDELSYPYFVEQHSRIQEPESPIPSILSAHVIRTGESLLLTKQSGDLSSQLQGVADEDSFNWLGVPLESDNGIIGALVMRSNSNEVNYTEQDRELLEFVSVQIAAAIKRKQMHTRLAYMAQYDQLTGLPNRALFLDRLRNALTRARREHSRFAVLYLDMDEFKQVNDNFGHIMGDRVLQMVAQRLTHCMRDSDTVGRLGGDEFIILLEHIHHPGDAVMIKEKVLAALGKPYEIGETTLHLNPSVGIAVYPDNGKEDSELISHADHAMYQAKKCSAAMRSHGPHSIL